MLKAVICRAKQTRFDFAAARFSTSNAYNADFPTVLSTLTESLSDIIKIQNKVQDDETIHKCLDRIEMLMTQEKMEGITNDQVVAIIESLAFIRPEKKQSK